jgi:hypothetical protein
MTLWKDMYKNSNFKRFVAEHFITFFNANSWMDYSKKFDLSIGTRLHGNMLAFQSEVPSIFLSHDSRTSELVDIMALPKCSLNSLSFISYDELFDKVSFSGIDYDLNRVKIAKQYVDIIRKCGLNTSTELNDFIL